MIKLIIKFRWYIIALFPITGLVFAFLLPRIQTDPEIRNYIPSGMESRIRTDSIEQEFGIQDIVMILFTDSSSINSESLERIRNIDRGLSRLPGILRRMSPFTLKTIRAEGGMMVVERLIEQVPGNQEEEYLLCERIRGNRFARNIVFSSDMKSASITAFIDTQYPESETIAKIDSIIDAYPGRARVIAGGLPYIRRSIMKDVQNDAYILVPAALVIMLLILKLSLRDWKSVLMPFSVVVVSTIVCIGIVPVAGWKLSLMTLLAPVILIAVANNYGIYLTARYQELSAKQPDNSREEIIRKLMGSLNMPILFSGLTTIAGILSLLTHSVIAARQVGILAASGVTLALVMSLLFIPAWVYLSSSYKPGNKAVVSHDNLQKLLSRVARKLVSHPVKTIIWSIVTVVMLSAGMIFLKIDTNQENYFSRGHPVRQASAIINRDFGGSQAVSVMIEGDIKDPAVMMGIDEISMRMEKKAGVGGVFSISQVVREMSKAIFDKCDPEYDAIPLKREGIAQLFELYNMSGDQDDFNQILNLDYTRSQVLVRLADPGNRVVKDVVSELEEIQADFPAKMIIGGYAVIMSDFAGLIISGQVSSLIFALVTVFLLLAIIFRSVSGGLIGTIPLFASIFILFGFMGFSGIVIDAATALLSSIMIGVGVDFTIQYIWCFNSFRRQGSGPEEAVSQAHETIGRSIIINALSVMAGFGVLVLSEFTSIRFFGYLVLISIGACLFGALVLIPAILVKVKPDFTFRKSISKN